ncbi:MAG TPA: PAS domain S-box protein [Spirochaetota bacterium]|nr:PAS domain S-box protein [Spirochaetota bacterium]HPJ35679.1 PAS domain S-box protein [Spirochaetota bacterium]
MIKILVIDDSRDNLITLTALLKNYFPDAGIISSVSPSEGIELAVEHKPDVIIVDYIMPLMSGIDVCGKLKSNPETSLAPVIMITASDTTAEIRATAFDTGADAFITKPVDEIELAAQMKAMLRIKITEDKLMEANRELESSLHLKESNYSSLFNSITDIVIIHDLEGHVLEVNRSGLEYFGLTENEVIGNSVLGLFNYQSITDISSNIMKMSSMDRKIIETSIRNYRGELVPVEVSSRLVEFNNDYAILSVFRDVKEKRNSDELKRLISLVVNDSDDAVIGITLGGEIVSWNSSAERIFGYSFDEINGSLYSILIPPYEPDFFPYLLERIRNGEKIDHYETTGVSKSDEQIYLSLKIVPIRDSLGEIIGASIIERDVTEEQKAREKIRKGKDFLKNLDEINPAFYIAIDAGANILSMNRTMLVALNYTLGEVVGRNYIELLFHETDRDIQRQDFNKMIQKKKIMVSETAIYSKSGEEMFVEWHGKPVLKVNGAVDFIFLVGIDITERKCFEKKVMETNSAERLRIGQDLHERLAQHLSGITFKNELLKVKVGEVMPEAAEDIDEISELVNSAVNRTREIAKRICPVENNPGGLLAAVKNLMDEIKAGTGVNILVRWDNEVNLSGKTEQSNLYYIINESVNNSIEVNNAKNIIVTLRQEGSLGIIEIMDDGKDYDEIDKERNRLFRSMIRYRSWLMGASVEMNSNPGGGVTVSCRFKLSGEALEENEGKKLPELKKKRGRTKSSVLLVDSHPVVRQGLKQIFEIEKDLAVVGETGNAEEALKLIGRLRPEMMTVDISLSGTGGIDLIKACRERYPTLPILVLSIYEESIYAERAIRAGARGYVMKDESPAVIVKALRTVLEGRQYMSDSLKEKLLDKLYSPKVDEATALVDSLTDREFEVFQLIGHGLGNKHIADKLHISVKTVENYREKIKTRLNISSSPELIQFAVNWIHNKTS